MSDSGMIVIFLFYSDVSFVWSHDLWSEWIFDYVLQILESGKQECFILLRL